MSSKPRKAFDGVGRPQGFIDDAARAALRAGERLADNIGRASRGVKTKVKPSIRQHIKGFAPEERQGIKEMYVGSKKGTYDNPYSAKAAPRMKPPIRQKRNAK